MLIDKTYFTGKLNIPNVEQAETANPDLVTNNNNLDRIIKEYEFKYLADVFGFLTTKTIFEQLEPDGTVKTTADQKYKDLINGDGNEWLGLRYEVNGIKYSQVANYVYCQYLYEFERRLTNLGVTVDEAEKSKVVSSWNKFNDAWREMIVSRQPYWMHKCYDYWYENNNQEIKSLYDYILDNQDWNTEYFKAYENTNSFGI